jgi:hypothetical protein
MAEKSSRKAIAKPAARSLKEKRNDKKTKSETASKGNDAITNVKKH